MWTIDNEVIGRDPAEATVSLTINGKACTAFPNETILHCARRHDIYIPTLCELDDIDHTPGTCRVCIVEIVQAGREIEQFVTSCNTPVGEGMVVQTRTPKVRAMQKLQVELLMADHLQDCATCTRHGDCELQDLAQFVGLKENRFFDRQRTEAREVDESSPALIRDMRRCVRCQRCVAVCRYHQEVDALVMSGTGVNRLVSLRHGFEQASSTCVSCGQCVLVCPTGALGERDETDRALDYICDPEFTTVVQFAPAVRVAFGEEFGMPPGTNVQGHVIAACRKIGVDVVLDTNFAADVVIMEEGIELLERLKAGRKPTFTSCCPAWINFAEIHYPDILPLLSSTKSPQQVLSTLAKTYLPEKLGVPQEKIRVISIMPCTAKKDEAVRPQLAIGDMPETDVVLTTREFARLLRREGIDLKDLEPSEFDNPYMSEFTGAGAIFGTTGGVMEAAVRTIYAVVNGEELEDVELTQLRGFEGVRTATVNLGGPFGDVKVAMCHGLGDTRALVEKVRSGDADFDFIEIMACPGGCVDGGGSLRSKKAYLPLALARRETIYNVDRTRKVRQSHNNEQVKTLYRDFLDAPNSEKAHKLLHTHYSERSRDMHQTVKEVWDDITMSTMLY
ncbi:ferredoxin hydrogenase gamma subunit [Rhodobium orientis]|uniref:(2Fe-2S)-binding protein n=1 Tax=Rhodobium orientis TaxID=34017 RepID=A0A327JQA3_9HYPH|nr:[FeFe] hydrogenase, group A [Rhodobium orientis]MBB4304595.1 ferredoxin hydrogenase gamma subunit [Rhodobium orientis]MBK5951371.1 (2Fe-2S)-binding protein [Rhodobium orientis]RAI27553.1 (2Fe-2S)-binding protein [Rhodobium orientis]